MKQLKRLVILLVVAAAGTSCASIVTRSIYPVDFNSTPQGAEVEIESRDGRIVYSGRTPATVWLEPSAGYMRPEHYKVTYRHAGGEPVTTWINARIDGWYFGNLFLGGLIGMLLIDPLTGAMWKIPPGSQVINVSPEPPLRAREASTGPATASGEWIELEN
jgi:hypothetical protein